MPQEQETSRFIPQPPYGPPRRNVPPPPNAAAPGVPMPSMPQGPMMPPPQGRRTRSWRERMLGTLMPNGLYAVGAPGQDIVPSWLAYGILGVFLFTLLAVTMHWSQYAMPAEFMAMSVISVILFGWLSHSLSVSWRRERTKAYKKNLFLVGLLLRLIYAVFTYYHNIAYFGAPIGDTADTGFFVSMGEMYADGLRHFNLISTIRNSLDSHYIAFDDTAYPITLGVVYTITGGISDVLIPFIYKAFMGAAVPLLIYNIANRHFGENVARIAGVFCMLNPNMIWWGTTMMKEADMIFFTTLYVDYMDKTLMSKRFSIQAIWPATLIGMWVFLYRAALGAVCFLALMMTIVLASNRIISRGKKWIVGILVALLLGISLGPRLFSDTRSMAEQVASGEQKENMEWRAERKGGNAFAKYAGAAVFAPLIFTIPFPTLATANAEQYSQMQLSGGNFIKNVLSFFVIMAMLVLLLTGEWRKHVFPAAMLAGYLMVLVLSGYAHSGRFHMPIWPLEMLFAAYGLCILPSQKKRWFVYVLVAEVVVCFAWQWFKLKGRGMI